MHLTSRVLEATFSPSALPFRATPRPGAFGSVRRSPSFSSSERTHLIPEVPLRVREALVIFSGNSYPLISRSLLHMVKQDAPRPSWGLASIFKQKRFSKKITHNQMFWNNSGASNESYSLKGCHGVDRPRSVHHLQADLSG